MNLLEELLAKQCKDYAKDATVILAEDALTMLTLVDGWRLNDDKKTISRRFEFKGFLKTMSFINSIAWLVNQENHHPEFTAGFNYCSISFTTHSIDGLSLNDFICAAKINQLFDG